LGNVRVVLWHKEDEVLWWLLATPPETGRHLVHTAEKLRDAMSSSQRITIDGFELVRLPKTGTAKSKLTWRMSESKYQGWRDSIIQTVRGRSHNSMSNMLFQLWSSPGFNGVRNQVGKLASLYREEVKRTSLKDAPRPPSRLFYLRRIPHTGISVKQLLAQHKIRKHPHVKVSDDGDA
jgi:hypothetical protein